MIGARIYVCDLAVKQDYHSEGDGLQQKNPSKLRNDSRQDVYCGCGISLSCIEILPAVRELMPDMAYFVDSVGANDGTLGDDMKLREEYSRAVVIDTGDTESMTLVGKIIF